MATRPYHLHHASTPRPHASRHTNPPHPAPTLCSSELAELAHYAARLQHMTEDELTRFLGLVWADDSLGVANA